MRLSKILIVSTFLGVFCSSASAQLTEKQEKLIAKEAKKEAKKLKKEGWMVPAGSFSIERQLIQAYQLQSEVDMDRQPKYNFGQAISGGSFYDAAKMQAVELAKAELAGNIITELTSAVNILVENRQISQKEAISSTNIIKNGKSRVLQKLNFIIPIIEIYRETKAGGIEVQIRIAYDKRMAMSSFTQQHEIKVQNNNSLISTSLFLADCYENGEGVGKDIDKAKMWYGIAAAQDSIQISDYEKKNIECNSIPSSQRGIAFVLGNSNYNDPQNSLQNPLNDATDIAEKLKSLGFDVLLSTDADRRSFDDTLYEFGEKAKNYDAALFYYAGHGVQSKGVNYFIPVDAELRAENEIQYECINVNRILDKLESSHCKTKIMILDACRNNPFERSWHRGISERGLSVMNAPEGIFIAYATSPGSVALDGNSRNSPYTEALIKMLDVPNLSLENFFKNVLREVKRKTNGKQTPWIASSFDGSFYFNTR